MTKLPNASLATTIEDLLAVSAADLGSAFGTTTRAPVAASGGGTEIVFIDARVDDQASLVAALGAHAHIVILSPDQDGLAQIASFLQGRHDVAAIHLISHGASGFVQAGSLTLDAAAAAARVPLLAQIGAALSADGDFLLYACDAAAGVAGQALIDALAELSGADVALSLDATGAAALGGNWTLEAHTGAIDSTLVAQSDGLANFQSLLAAPASETFDGVPLTGNYNLGTPGAARILNNWTFTLLNAAGTQDTNGYVDVTNKASDTTLADGGGDKAALLNGTFVLNGTGLAAGVLKATSGEEFKLVSIRVELGFSGGNDYRLVGYRDSGAVSGATQNFTAAPFGSGGTLVTVTGPQWANLDEVRIVRQGGDTDISLYIDDIVVAAPVFPTITSAGYNAATGVLTVTGTDMTAGDAIAVSRLSLTGENGASYTLTTASVTATNATTFSVTLNAADKRSVNGLLNLDGTSAVGGTVFNLAGISGWESTAASPADTTGNPVTVSNVTAPTITAAAYDATTNILLVTGTNLVHVSGATNDVTVSSLTVTGEGGATRTLATTGNVEIISSTSFSVTVNGADAVALDALLNRNGNSSLDVTTYNLAAADDWNSVITGGNIADGTNAITVSNVPPVITSATYDATSGVLNVTGANMMAGDSIAVSRLVVTGQGGTSYVLTTGSVTAASATFFTVTLNAADKLMVNGLLNRSGTIAVDGTAFNLAGVAGWESTANAPADSTGNPVTVSNINRPAITSATYDAATHILSVTGTDLVALPGVGNDITVSTLTVLGEGGATHTLSTTGNVDVTSATSFSVTVTGADIAALDALLNKNGTSSLNATTYNLAAADDWNTVVSNSSIADSTNALTVSNAAAILISATYDATTGVLNVTGANMTAGDSIAVSRLVVTGEGGASYVLTTGSVMAASATFFTVTLNAADKLMVNGLLNRSGAIAVDGTAFNLAGVAGWDSTANAPADSSGNPVTVSNTNRPTITSATYDAATNVLSVTGTDLVALPGVGNDITVSTLTVLGEGGATHTLSTTGNVDVTSATSFSVTVSGADIAALNTLLNKNGTVRSTPRPTLLGRRTTGTLLSPTVTSPTTSMR